MDRFILRLWTSLSLYLNERGFYQNYLTSLKSTWQGLNVFVQFEFEFFAHWGIWRLECPHILNCYVLPLHATPSILFQARPDCMPVSRKANHDPSVGAVEL